MPPTPPQTWKTPARARSSATAPNSAAAPRAGSGRRSAVGHPESFARVARARRSPSSTPARPPPAGARARRGLAAAGPAGPAPEGRAGAPPARGEGRLRSATPDPPPTPASAKSARPGGQRREAAQLPSRSASPQRVTVPSGEWNTMAGSARRTGHSDAEALRDQVVRPARLEAPHQRRARIKVVILVKEGGRAATGVHVRFQHRDALPRFRQQRRHRQPRHPRANHYGSRLAHPHSPPSSSIANHDYRPPPPRRQ